MADMYYIPESKVTKPDVKNVQLTEIPEYFRSVFTGIK